MGGKLTTFWKIIKESPLHNTVPNCDGPTGPYLPAHNLLLMCVCVHACVRTCVCACARACVHACVRACVRACVPASVYASGRACKSADMEVCT